MKKKDQQTMKKLADSESNNKKNLDKQDVKYEEENSTMSQRKRRGRPKKNPEISSQSAQLEQKEKNSKENSMIEERSEARSAKREQTSSTTSRKRKPKPKPQQPNEHDLCEALLLLRTKLPNRSLQKIIIRLFQTVEEKQKNKESIFSRSQIDSRSRRDFDSSVCSERVESNFGKDDNGVRNEDHMSVVSKQTGARDNISKGQKLVVPGRKVSCYHDKVGEVAALSHELYKNNIPTLEDLQMMEKSMSNAPFLSKARRQKASSKLQYQDESSFNSKKFHYKQIQTLKTVFYNPQEESRYKQRRELTQLFIDRGYGITKAIDNDLPKMNIERQKYKNLLGGVLTMTFRKLESFITNQCKRTIKYLDREQMKSTSYMLLNCRVKLQPAACQTFFKFLRIGYGLGDVTIYQSEAIELYVGIMKHLYGKNITMEACQKMGRIKNQRDMQSTLQVLKQKAQRDHVRNKANTQYEKTTVRTDEDQDYNSQVKNQEQWNTVLEFQLANLYVKCKDIYQIREEMIKTYPKIINLSIRDFEVKLSKLMDEGLGKLQKQNQLYLPNGPFLLKLEPEHVSYIKFSPEGEEIRCLILSYLFSSEPALLSRFIQEINLFIEAAGDLKSYLCDQADEYIECFYPDDPKKDPQFLSYNPVFDNQADFELDNTLLEGINDEQDIAYFD